MRTVTVIVIVIVIVTMPHVQSYLYCPHPRATKDSGRSLCMQSQSLGTLLVGETFASRFARSAAMSTCWLA